MPSTKTVPIKLAEDSALGKRGQIIHLALGPNDVHVSEEMPNYLAGYKPGPYRAEDAVKPILVDRDKDQYRTFDEDDAFLRVQVKGSMTGAVPEIDPKSAMTEYSVGYRYIGSFIPDPTERNVTNPNYRLRQVAMKRCKRALALDYEIDVWTKLTDTAEWDSNNHTTLGATAKWNGGSASDPLLDLHTRIEASAQQVTDVWMNQKVAHAFLRHDKVRDYMKQYLGDAGVAGMIQKVSDAVAMPTVDFALPGLPPVHVVAGKFKENSSSTLGFILGNHVVLTTAPPGTPTDGEEIATAYCFRAKGPSGVGYSTREIRIDNRGPEGGTLVVASVADVIKVTSKKAGGLIKDAWQ